MLRATTIQERLWELRKDKGLNLEELSKLTGISKSALASYEANDYKEINHGNLVTLADFYQVSVDYLLCRTENREQANTPLMELHLTDEMVALLKSGRINNRLLCEIATNDKFEQLMTDTEIYIDGHATSTFRTLYESLEEQRHIIVQKYKQADKDFYSKTILAAEVKEENFFCHVTHKTWDAILHDIRKAHEHDIDSKIPEHQKQPLQFPAQEKIKTAVVGMSVPATAAFFIRRYMQFLSHSRHPHSRCGKNSPRFASPLL